MTGSAQSLHDSDVEKGEDAPVDRIPEAMETPKINPREAQWQVQWSSADPENPLNFPAWKKAGVTFNMALLAFVGSFASSIIAPAQADLVANLHASYEETVLTVSLFVLGYAFGPLLWGPVSEVYGRRVSMLPGVFMMGIFSIATAECDTMAGVLVTRFIGGLFASAPVSNASAAIGDVYAAKVRGVPMAFMALCIVGGPIAGPIAGAAIVTNPHLDWRWTEYIQAIVAFAAFALAAVSLPETYHPVLLRRRAKSLRKAGEDRWWHPHEAEKMRLGNIVTKYLYRPFRMLFTESMLAFMALYAAFVYGLLFFQLEAFPIVFFDHRHFSLLPSTLPLLGLFVGVIFALGVNFANQPYYAKAVERNGGKAVPEARLPPMVLGGVLFAAGIFWFGWTSSPSYHWIIPTVAAGFIGAGFNIVLQQALNFIVDTYGPFAASAIAATAFLRAIFAFALPLAARPLFVNLGVGPGCSVLGGIACLALPVPFIFMRYGRVLRERSAFVVMPGSGSVSVPPATQKATKTES